MDVSLLFLTHELYPQPNRYVLQLEQPVPARDDCCACCNFSHDVLDRATYFELRTSKGSSEAHLLQRVLHEVRTQRRQYLSSCWHRHKKLEFSSYQSYKAVLYLMFASMTSNPIDSSLSESSNHKAYSARSVAPVRSHNQPHEPREDTYHWATLLQ